MRTVVVRFADADAVAYYIATAGFIDVSRRTRRSDAASDAASCVNEKNKRVQRNPRCLQSGELSLRCMSAHHSPPRRLLLRRVSVNTITPRTSPLIPKAWRRPFYQFLAFFLVGFLLGQTEEINRFNFEIKPKREDVAVDGVSFVEIEKKEEEMGVCGEEADHCVVEGNAASFGTSEILRKAGLMYRHLVCKRNMTSLKDRGVHQRNTALEHIELYKLDGVVYFADDDNVYSLELFQSLRQIRYEFEVYYAQNLECLLSMLCCLLFQETTFIEQVVADESDMQGVPPDCSRILNWHLHLDAGDIPYPQGWSIVIFSVELISKTCACTTVDLIVSRQQCTNLRDHIKCILDFFKNSDFGYC
ncbi:hypothetical protein IGI04_036817 [Brassica rapa subsp. trilocularis]|uniref:Glycosyltransferases n=1 Tax=Brassica rapa subsp. trilocularis TaxID=1813537 RepID=A0ABQ7LGI3_BRACM|nr:hypothetical protein IGI04_036817 [Brassica rapa subsp. trilocularis]